MKTHLQQILKSELFRDISILISGTALAQLIPILLRPVLSRIFSVEMFGAYSVYSSLIGILIVIASLKYELAIILPEKDKEAINIFILTIFLNFLFNSFLLIAILVFKTEILKALNLNEAFAIYLYFVPLGTFFLSTYQSINYWLIRKKRFFPISLNKFVRRGFEGYFQVFSNFLNIPHGLIFGDIIGHISNVVSGIYQGIKSGLSFKLISISKLRYVIFKFSEYPKYNVVPGFMSACSYLLPALMINKFYSTQNAGYFDQSKLLLSIPLALIASSISNVLLQRVSEKNKSNSSIQKDLYSILVFVLLAVLFEIGVILLWSEDIFRLFFGSEWIFSGTISKMLVWAFAFNFIVTSFSSVFISLKKIKLLSIWQVFYFLSIISLFWFNNLAFNSFLKLYVIIEVICCAIISIMILYVVMNYEKQVAAFSLNKTN